ncbi:MAG: hypothetical protein WCK89_13165 [bacterium]
MSPVLHVSSGMCFSPYGWYLSAIVILWAAWFIVLCREREWFHGLGKTWLTMGPLTSAVMAVMCAYCTVKAQKPGNANYGGGGGTNAPQMTAPQQNGGSAASSLANVTARQQGAPQAEPMNASSAPSRVVFQSTPASDPRTTVAFGAEPGWGIPAIVPATPDLNAVSFGDGGTNTPSPVCFADTATVTVQTLILVTRGAAADLATLTDAPESARLRITAAEGQEPEMSGPERLLTEQFLPDRWLTVGIDFETPADLPGLFFGGSAGRPEWFRNWRGEIAEIVGFDTPPDADVRAGVANYLSLRWGFGGHPATSAQRQAAINAGLHYGNVWSTLLILK